MFSLRLYNRGAWTFLFTTHEILEAMRVGELAFIAFRFLLFRAPMLILWTRLPVLRGRKAPYGELAQILGPQSNRPPFLVFETGEIALGDIKTKDELARFIQTARREASAPCSTVNTIIAGVAVGLLVQWGPAFIKLGETLSMRPEVSPFLREQFRLMQDRIPRMKDSTARKCIEKEMKEMGVTVEEAFEWIDMKPLASAALCQVHQAKLRGGKKVALKIQRPYIEAIQAIDSLIIESAASWGWRLFHGTRKADPRLFGQAYSVNFSKEIDFFLEGRMQELFAEHINHNHAYSKTVKVAKIYADLSTKKLLVMELVEHYHSMDRLLELDQDMIWEILTTKVPAFPNEEPAHLFRAIGAVWGDALLNGGILYGEPHLGNVFLLEPQDGNGWRIFFSDFGLVNELSDHLKYWIVDWLRALLWLADGEEFFRVAVRYVEPFEVLDTIHPRFGVLVRSPYSSEVVEKVRSIIPSPDADPYLTNIRNFIVRRYFEGGVQDSESSITLRTRIPGGKTVGSEAWDLMQRFSIPLKIDKVFSHDHWLLFNALINIEGLTSTFSIHATWEEIFLDPLRDQLISEAENELRDVTVVDVRDYLGGVRELVQRHNMAWLLRQGAKVEAPRWRYP